MKKGLRSIFFVVSLIGLSSNVFSNNKIDLNILFTNQLDKTASVIFNSNYKKPGPIVERNGGSTNYTFKTKKNELTSIDFLFVSMGVPCTLKDGNILTLNPNLYTGDTINIVFSNFVADGNYDRLVCTCAGSSCDESIAEK